MRKLAHIEQVKNIKPMDGYDNIVQCNVLGWNLIIKKDEFKDNDKCVYIECDSVLPSSNPNFEFLAKKKYKIKTMKLRGFISQGICFPLTILSKPAESYKIGDDVTGELNIKQIEDEIPDENQSNRTNKFMAKHNKFFKSKPIKFLMKYNWFRNIIFLFIPKTKKHKFPAFVVKTDENRLQNCPWVLEQYKDKNLIITEKLDGTSATYSLEKKGRKFDFAVCSRNVRQDNYKKKCFYEKNVYWEIAFKHNVEDVLKDIQKKNNAKTVVLQGEIIGEQIQKNKYKISGLDFYAFNLILDGVKTNSVTAKEILQEYGIKFVPILDSEFKLYPTVDEMIKFADGNSVVFDTLREGLVIRDYDNTVSFKCISNQFLLKWDL